MAPVPRESVRAYPMAALGLGVFSLVAGVVMTVAGRGLSEFEALTILVAPLAFLACVRSWSSPSRGLGWGMGAFTVGFLAGLLLAFENHYILSPIMITAVVAFGLLLAAHLVELDGEAVVHATRDEPRGSHP